MTACRILLLGKGGQVGQALRDPLSSLGTVESHDRTTCDIENPEQLRMVVRRLKPQIVINAAAYTSVDRAETDAALCHRVNAIAPAILADEAKTIGAWLVHYSTDYVFDGQGSAAYCEDDAPSPINVYGRSKLAGDQAIVAVDGNYIILRVSWVYGLAGHNFAKTILRLASERSEIRVVADQFGAPTSADLIADVTAQVVGQCLRRDTETDDGVDPHHSRGVYHLAPKGAVSWHGYATELIRQARLAGHRLRLDEPGLIAIGTEDYPTPARRPKNSVLDTSKICRVFGIDLPDWQFDIKRFVNALDHSNDN